MLSTGRVVFDWKDVPTNWAFSFYCKVPLEQFDGSAFKIRSILNNRDDNPSMSFYMKDGNYRFNDFSSGYFGSPLNLVKELFKLDYTQGANRLVNDYNDWLRTNNSIITISSLKEQEKYKVSGYKLRDWNVIDSKRWTDFNIGRKLLDRYYVKPLESFDWLKCDNLITIQADNLYGYFKQDGTLYKIYRPGSKTKFIKVNDYIQGSEQVKKRPYLGYLSSLKDVMSFESLGFNIDTKAPDSENTLLPQYIIEKDMKEYEWVFILFDVDEAGIKAANKYQYKYGLKPVYLNYGQKDLSDHVREFKPNKVKQWLTPLLDRHLNEFLNNKENGYTNKESICKRSKEINKEGLPTLDF